MKKCPICGTELDDKAKVCIRCGKDLRSFFGKNKAWIIGVTAFVIVGAIATFGSTDNNSKQNETKNNNTQVTTSKNANKEKKEETKKSKKENEKDFIKSCKTYKYKELARNPNKYKGKNLKFKGKVIQVQEGFFNQVNLRVNVTKDEYGFWNDTIWVDYKYEDENESKLLENDIITLYGEFQGQKTYTSVLGAAITIPSVKAQYIKLNSK